MASTRMMVLPLYFSSSVMRLFSLSAGMFSASTMCPLANSLAGRISRTTAWSALTSAVSSRVDRLLPPLRSSCSNSRTSRTSSAATSR